MVNLKKQHTAHEHKEKIHFCQRVLGRLIFCHWMKDATAELEHFAKITFL